MNKYKCIDNSRGYENSLTEGKVYTGEVKPGLFANWPYLVVINDHGKPVTAYLSRFEEVTA